MAKEGEDIEVQKEKTITVNDEGKTPVVEADTKTTVAPMDQTTDEAPAKEDIDDVLMLLNMMDKESGGKGEIAEIPDGLRGSIGFLVDKLNFVRELFEDPDYKALLDDLADQKEDGQTPSVKVAIARNIPIEDIQSLADTEDYEGVQNSLTDSLTAQKQADEEDALFEANFQESKAAGDTYAAEMGYDEEEKQALFDLVLELFRIMGDGKLTVEEFRRVDKMRNFDKITEDLRSQIPTGDTKEVLPDQASIETAKAAMPAPQPSAPANSMGMGSMSAYQDPMTDVTAVRGQGRRGK